MKFQRIKAQVWQAAIKDFFSVMAYHGGMEQWCDLLWRCMRNRSGVAAIEYAFIAALICIAVIAALRTLGIEVGGLFDTVVEAFGNDE